MRFRCLAALCLIGPPAIARSYTVDDLLALESYGNVSVSTDGRTAVIERRGAFDTAPRFDFDWASRRLTSSLYTVDLMQGTGIRPLFRPAPGTGYWGGGFSPSGQRLALFSLHGRQLRAGVYDLRTHRLRSYGFAPDQPDQHAQPIWLDERHLLIVRLDDGGLPEILQTATNGERFARQGWANQQTGTRATALLRGSGRYLDSATRYRARSILLLDVETGKARLLFTGDVLDLSLSADRSRLAIVTAGPLVQAQPGMPIDPAFEPRRARLTLLDMANGHKAHPCGDCDILPSLLHWSPSGARLLFFGRQDGKPWDAGTLQLYGGDTARSLSPQLGDYRPALLTIAGNARMIHAAWSGAVPLIYAERARDGRRDWIAVEKDRAVAMTSTLRAPAPDLASIDAHHIWIGGDGALWRGEIGGALERLASEPLTIARPQYGDPFLIGTRDVYNRYAAHGMAVLGGSAPALRIDTDKGMPTLPISGTMRVLATSPAGIALTYDEDAHGVGALHLLSARSDRVIDHINRHLAAIAPPRRVLVTSQGSDGTTRYHWLTLPAAAGTTPPRLIVIPYPGIPYTPALPRDSGPSVFNTFINPPLLAGAGYAVLQPSIPLAEGASEPLATIVPAVEEALDATRKTGLVSTAKPFLLGQSYGGYAVMALAAKSDRFAAVVAASGPYDLAAGYGQLDPRLDSGERGYSLTIPIGWYENGQGRMGAAPWQDLARYVRNSPYYAVEEVHIPVLLFSGDQDYVPTGETDRLFLALYRLGKDAQMIRYWGEAHSLVSPANVRDYWSRVLDFFAQHSADQPSPQ